MTVLLVYCDPAIYHTLIYHDPRQLTLLTYHDPKSSPFKFTMIQTICIFKLTMIPQFLKTLNSQISFNSQKSSIFKFPHFQISPKSKNPSPSNFPTPDIFSFPSGHALKNSFQQLRVQLSFSERRPNRSPHALLLIPCTWFFPYFPKKSGRSPKSG
jgi:hypothetical protein